MYDGSTLDTDKEKELQAKRAELNDIDLELSDELNKYEQLGARDWERTETGKLKGVQADLDNWHDDFYKMTGGDYLMGMVGDIATWAATQYVSNAIGDWWEGTKELADTADAGADLLDSGVDYGLGDYDMIDTGGADFDYGFNYDGMDYDLDPILIWDSGLDDFTEVINVGGN
jgi:hypothetical protein